MKKWQKPGFWKKVKFGITFANYEFRNANLKNYFTGRHLMVSEKELVEQAIKAKEKAIPTYSNFHVGAALLTKEGKIIIGANIENASYGLTICAERTAVFKALLDGERNFKVIAIAGDSDNYITPCGACRQILMEFCGGDLEVLMINQKGEYTKKKMSELLPYSFGEEFLK